MPLADEIRQILAVHAGQRMDHVALFMFLNTVGGGHYEERYSEEELLSTLDAMLRAGAIAATPGPDGTPKIYRLR
ncbi:MAG: hypothetical protein ACRDG4_03460 [Chloroflexota bacterium]